MNFGNLKQENLQIKDSGTYKHDKSNPFSELFLSLWLVPNKTIISPLSYSKALFQCQQFNDDKLKSATGNKDEWIQGKRIEPKMRTFVPLSLFEMERKTRGVKFGETVSGMYHQELLEYHWRSTDCGGISILQQVVILLLKDRHLQGLVISMVRQLFVSNQMLALSDDSFTCTKLLDEQN